MDTKKAIESLKASRIERAKQEEESEDRCEDYPEDYEVFHDEFIGCPFCGSDVCGQLHDCGYVFTCHTCYVDVIFRGANSLEEGLEKWRRKPQREMVKKMLEEGLESILLEIYGE